MNQRRLLMKTIAGMGVLTMGPLTHAQPTPAMGTAIKRAIPSSGEQIPVIGLGTYQAFRRQRRCRTGTAAGSVARGGCERRQCHRQLADVRACRKRRGRALTAELSLRPSLFLATKVWTSGKEAGIRQMEESFRLLRTQTMDLMQIHNLVDWRTHTATLKDWKRQGRVRYIGITHYHSGAYDELERLLKTRDHDFVQLNYSIAEREAERSILPLAQQMGVAVIANRPFAQSSLFSRVRGKTVPPWAAEFDCTMWAQFFLKYIVSHPALTCAIPATHKPEHLRDNMMAGVGRCPMRRCGARWLTTSTVCESARLTTSAAESRACYSPTRPRRVAGQTRRIISACSASRSACNARCTLSMSSASTRSSNVPISAAVCSAKSKYRTIFCRSMSSAGPSLTPNIAATAGDSFGSTCRKRLRVRSRASVRNASLCCVPNCTMTISLSEAILSKSCCPRVPVL